MNRREVIEAEIDSWYNYIDDIQYELLQKELTATRKMELHFLSAKAKRNIAKLEEKLRRIKEE